jgi:cell division FtsZ-interacting protein ZapD
MNTDELAAEYDRLRAELKRVLAAPEKDMALVNELIDRLDRVHMEFKAAHGLIGNNPNE